MLVKIKDRLLSFSRVTKQLIAICVDLSLIALSLLFSFFLVGIDLNSFNLWEIYLFGLFVTINILVFMLWAFIDLF